MTKIKLCGISSLADIEAVNSLNVDFIGFVFAKKSKRFVSPENADKLKKNLSEKIRAVGVFVNEPLENVAKLLEDGTIDIAQLHGSEDEEYINKLRGLTNKSIIKAFRVDDTSDMAYIECCSADYVLLDSGAGSGESFEWDKIKNIKRPFFLAGGLNAENVETAINDIHPFAVDVSSGIESNGLKDYTKMANFVAAVRREKNDDK